jgi:hypothetical protein
MTSIIIRNYAIPPIILLLLILTPHQILSQQGKPIEVSKEILEHTVKDVWIPFMESYRELNVEIFKSIHAKNVTRVSINMNKIEDRSTYFKSLDRFFLNIKKMKRQMDIKFSILSSATSENKVYQTGYYCFSSRGSDTEAFQPRGYGFFNVILIKENGVWKITVDADKQLSISEDEFRRSGVIYELN